MMDITSIEDIRLLVNTFYSHARNDSLLGPIFNRVIGDKWELHLNKMYTFWQTVLLEEHTYSGRPFPPHMPLGLEKEHFERWVQLFRKTISENFSGPKADEAVWRAEKMAEMFFSKLDFIRSHGNTPVD